MARIFIDETTKITRYDLYRVELLLPGGTEPSVLEPRCLFPISAPGFFISLLNEKGEEMAMIKDLSNLETESAKAVSDCLDEYYLIPKILHVFSVKDQYGTLVWNAETDRGMVTFCVKDRHSDIKLLPGTTRLMVRDSNDNRYEIPDTEKLDPKSHHLLFSYI